MHKNFAAKLDYSLQLITGTDEFGARCFSYVLAAPKADASRQGAATLALPQDAGIIVHSGWGEPSALDEEQALEKLKQHLR